MNITNLNDENGNSCLDSLCLIVSEKSQNVSDVSALLCLFMSLGATERNIEGHMGKKWTQLAGKNEVMEYLISSLSSGKRLNHIPVGSKSYYRNIIIVIWACLLNFYIIFR